MENAAGRSALLVAFALLAGCGGGDDERSAPDLVLLTFPCRGSGTITRTALSLDSPDLQPWLDRVSGHHEAGLNWEQLEWTERVGGFDERTTLAMDVTVLGAYEYVYVPKTYSECRAESRRSMEVEIRLATADGAFDGNLRHTLGFYPGYAESSPRLESPQLFTVELERFARTFEIGMEPPLDDDPRSVVGVLQVSFTFQEDGLHGALQPTLSAAPDAYGHRPSWTPLEGHFPDVCSEGEALDRVWDELGGAPRALYDEYISHWPAAPMTARYVHPDDFPVWYDALAETQLTSSVGPLVRVCDSPDLGRRFFGPLQLESSDGRVRFAREMETDLPGGFSRATSPRARAAELESVFGIDGVDLRSATHGSVQFETQFAPPDTQMSGRLSVRRDARLTEEETSSVWASPALVWCTGRPQCGGP